MKGKIAIVSGGRYSALTAIQLNEAYQQGIADAIDECISKIDELPTYYAGDKEGNAITPKVVIKEDVIKALEQLKEQDNGRF